MAWHTPISRLFIKQPEVTKIKRRRYAGAAISRLTDGWVTSNTSADAEIKVSLRKLRDRSRQLMRDNPYAKQAKRTTQINVIGQGVKLQCMVPAIRGKKKDKKLSDITILGTGGTIASFVDYKTGAVSPAITAEQLVNSVSSLKEIANILFMIPPKKRFN